MAVEKKQVFKQNLKSFDTFIQDTASNSTYFNITELESTLTGGKNSFLIEGSELLELGTEIKIEILDSSGNPVYTEAGKGFTTSSFDTSGNPIITEYYEGTSKVVAIYVYTDTAYGPGQITILGEAKYYLDQNNIRQEIPAEWRGTYNVKWQKNITINPALPNTTKVRFYKRPHPIITEILSPIYRIESGSKVASNVTASFASINVSQLETFAGDVKRVKVFRTSQGDISDYDLIQDIYVESKELLTTYNISGSVKGEAGLFTSDTLSKAWNTGSLNAYLTSSRIDNGLSLKGSGYLTYTSFLNLNVNNTYELGIDTFYSASTNSNLGLYLSYETMSLVTSTNPISLPYTIIKEIGKIEGLSPTTLKTDLTFPFTLDYDFKTASLYLSQSQSEWHVGNISLKLSEDTAFSPSEVSFVTSMPTIIGNETYNFKFEFYDVNNNYVPVAVTQSATFTGGNNNIGGTITLISGSTTLLSQSVSNDLWFSTSSITSSIVNAYSTSVSTSVTYTSSSVFDLSSSAYNSLTIVSGGITLLSSSYLLFTQSYYSESASFDTRISSSISQSNANITQSIYSASAFLDTFIFTNQSGALNQPPTASAPGLYLGSSYLGYFSGSGTSGWKTYMDDQGDFYLTGSNGQFLAWASSLGTLQVQGQINIQEGGITNAATKAGVTASVGAATSSLSNSLAPNIFTNANGLINRPPSTLVGVPAGLYLSPSYLGYYTGSNWNTYMGNDGKFFLTGSASNYLKWDGTTLTIQGSINITGGNGATTTDTANAALSASNYSASAASFANSLDSRIFTNSSGLVNKTPSTSTSGLYLGSTYLGYYNGSAWKTYMDNSGKFYLSGTGDGLSWDGSTLSINGTINITGGNAATSSSVYSVATNSANTAYTNASASAYTQANTAYTNAKTIADNIANGSYSGGTLISGQSIISPIVAGAAGYFSEKFKVGNGGITLDGTNKKIFIGAGTFGNSNTGFYADNDGNFSLGNQLTFTGGNLSIAGAASIGGSTATSVAAGAAAGATAIQNGNAGLNLGVQNGSVGGWTINPSNLTSNNGRTILYNTGYIALKNSEAQDKVTIDSSPTLPNPSAGSDSGTLTIPALSANTTYYANGGVSGGTGHLMGPDGNGWYAVEWSLQSWFTPAITGYYEFTTWFPKNSGLGSSGYGGTGAVPLQQLRAYIYDAAGNPLINDDGREYLAGPQESGTYGTYGDQYPRNGTGAYFSNQYLTAGVPVRFLIQYIVYNIPYDANLTINAYWPATSVNYIQNVPKVNINQEGFQVVQDTNRYFRIRPSGWYMYNDPAEYGGSPPPYLADQGVATVTGVMGGTMVVLNASDHEWHSTKQKEYIRTAQYSFSNRAAGGNFITSFFFGGYGRSYNLTRAYAIFRPDVTTGFTDFSANWYGYAYNIENITKIATNKFHVTFVEAVMDSAGAYYANGIYTVFIGTRNVDYPGEFQTAAISNQTHLGFDMELTAESTGNISLLVMA